MTIWRKISDAIYARALEADDERFLECLQVVMNRARVEFSCPKCDSPHVTVSGIDDSDVDHHVHANCRCGNCGCEFTQLTHQFMASAAHAVTTFEAMEMFMAAKAAGVAPVAGEEI